MSIAAANTTRPLHANESRRRNVIETSRMLNDFVERRNLVECVGALHRPISWTHRQQNLATGVERGVEFFRRVRDKQNLLRRPPQFVSDASIAVDGSLRSDSRVEECADQRNDVR